MKKTLLVLGIALTTCFFASAQVTDTIVSTAPSNRNVLIEEYTGINCGCCPDGHKKANAIQAAHPDRVNIINIHQGGYAANTFTTQWGNALAGQIGLEGYPAGTVNRHIFSQYSSVLDVYRDYWSSCANTILGMSSPVNIAAEGTLDMTTRTLNIRVQLYYTGSQTVTSNALNIAILQDSIMGPQSGASNFNPGQIINGQYCHMHMLRHLITGQWGETIDNIAPGTLIEKTYEYAIPEQFGTPNPIDAILKNLSVVAFVCEGHKEVLTSIEVPLVRVNYPAIAAHISGVNSIDEISCTDQARAYFQFMNDGLDALTSMTYTYNINGVTETATWTGNVASYGMDTVNIPTFSTNLNTNTTLTVQVTQLNGVEVNVLPKTLTVKKNAYSNGGWMYFLLYTDRYASETTFKFFDPNNNVVLSGGPFSNLSSNGTTKHEYGFAPQTVGCYRLEVYDSYGDGINTGFGAGYFELRKADNSVLFHDDGKFGSKAVYMIDVTAPSAIEEHVAETTVYPNPATDNITINSTENVQRVEIFNMQGQLVKAENGYVTSLSVKDLANGVYTLKLTTDNGTSMHKIVKK